MEIDMKKKLEVLFAVIIIFVGIYLLSLMGFLPVFCYPVRYDGPYEGKVVDADTGKPIEGVVILGVWYKELPTPAGAVSSYYDAMETVTNKNGEFEIHGLGLKIFSNVTPMRVLIFKSGYEHLGLWLWESFKEDEILKKKVVWEGKKAIISLKKLTMEERRKSATFPHHPEVPEEKIKKMLEEIQKERKKRGLD
jgi:hypothetical protein